MKTEITAGLFTTNDLRGELPSNIKNVVSYVELIVRVFCVMKAAFLLPA